MCVGALLCHSHSHSWRGKNQKLAIKGACRCPWTQEAQLERRQCVSDLLHIQTPPTTLWTSLCKFPSVKWDLLESYSAVLEINL